MVWMAQKIYCEYTYELRWKFVYTNKPAKFGLWTRAPDNPLENASAQNRDGLAFALIEGKHRVSRQTITLAECTAADYVQHRWVAALACPLSPGAGFHAQGAIQGMELVTRDYIVEVYLDGTKKLKSMLERVSNYA